MQPCGIAHGFSAVNHACSSCACSLQLWTKVREEGRHSLVLLQISEVVHRHEVFLRRPRSPAGGRLLARPRANHDEHQAHPPLPQLVCLAAQDVRARGHTVGNDDDHLLRLRTCMSLQHGGGHGKRLTDVGGPGGPSHRGEQGSERGLHVLQIRVHLCLFAELHDSHPGHVHGRRERTIAESRSLGDGLCELLGGIDARLAHAA
mmetsp:Transcript_43755/g.112660  ORF Transcript_43755/g.112660 Transcript_43755/m.112660 type:complete len:204 (-) Transcript_43755:1906-2517(-)